MLAPRLADRFFLARISFARRGRVRLSQQQQQQQSRSLIEVPQQRSSTAALLEEIGEVASSPSGAESLARELGPAVIADLKSALGRVQAGAVSEMIPLSLQQKFRLTLESGIPFVGFGFIDNSGMLIFGDQIDMSLGVTFSLSALASAALGNMISDVLGISLGSTIAAWAGRLGLPAANLTLEQSMSRSARRWRQFGSTIGVIIGCLLGMFPLLFIDSKRTHRLKRHKAFNDLFGAAISFVGSEEALGGESASLFVVDRAKNELWTRASKELDTDVRIPLNVGLAGLCATTGLPVNVQDAYKDPSFSPKVDMRTGIKTRSVLCTPIFDRHGSVIGVLEVINKRSGHFNVDDERSLSAMAAHVAMVLEDALAEEHSDEDDDSEMRLLDQLKACVSHAKAHHRFNSQRASVGESVDVGSRKRKSWWGR